MPFVLAIVGVVALAAVVALWSRRHCVVVGEALIAVSVFFGLVGTIEATHSNSTGPWANGWVWLAGAATLVAVALIIVGKLAPERPTSAVAASGFVLPVGKRRRSLIDVQEDESGGETILRYEATLSEERRAHAQPATADATAHGPTPQVVESGVQTGGGERWVGAAIEMEALQGELVGVDEVQFSARVRNHGPDSRFDSHVSSDIDGATNPPVGYGHFNLFWEGSRDDFKLIRQGRVADTHVARFFPSSGVVAFMLPPRRDDEPYALGNSQRISRSKGLSFDLQVRNEESGELTKRARIYYQERVPGQPWPNLPVLQFEGEDAPLLAGQLPAKAFERTENVDDDAEVRVVNWADPPDPLLMDRLEALFTEGNRVHQDRVRDAQVREGGDPERIALLVPVDFGFAELTLASWRARVGGVLTELHYGRADTFEHVSTDPAKYPDLVDSLPADEMRERVLTNKWHAHLHALAAIISDLGTRR